MLVLSILHNVFLTQDEIDQLISGDIVETTGVSLPVWFFKGNTSEPAEEVFCKYKLVKGSRENSIEVDKMGYVIHIPDGAETLKLEDLFPEVEGGKEYLAFQEISKTKKRDKNATVIHLVEIKTVERLLKSMDV